jgi:hypothetical protein
MKKRTLYAALFGILLVPALAFTFGGWAVITVDDLPDYVVAGKQMDVGFVIRQHGVTLLPGLSPRVTMKTERRSGVSDGSAGWRERPLCRVVDRAERRRLQDAHRERIRPEREQPAAIAGNRRWCSTAAPSRRR